MLKMLITYKIMFLHYCQDKSFNFKILVFCSFTNQFQLFENDKPSHYVNACDPSSSNWMRYVNCARAEEEQNVTAYQYQGEIYYRAHRPIPAGAEILVFLSLSNSL